MNPPALMMFPISLIIGTITTLLSHHWLLAWIGLEINTLAVLPIMTKTPHPRAIEAATKYFLTQTTASALMLFSCLMSAMQTGEWDINNPPNLMMNPMFLAIMMKLGLVPLHFWLPEVLQGTSLLTGLILSTWQKIPPLTLLLQISPNTSSNLTVIIGLISILIGGWSGVGQTQIRKIMAFSSIGHLGWMTLILKFNPQLSLFTFIMYTIMTTATFLSLIVLSTTKMSQISTSWTKNPALTTTTMLTLLSLAGLPPLTGFQPKLLIILELIKQNMIIITAMAMLASLLALFFYLRLTYIITLTLSPNTHNSTATWRTSTKPQLMLATTNTMALTLLPLTPTILLV
uniref:NADH-ubiquinone oxidoreductase chain 2 n=1 Tax=Odorrana hainanensis TaxID=431935 RepID=A0A1X9IFD6_ODOHA|nr:NADH dehydrogenase subunit 2 [Odorrana hainanensis]AOW70446.1 NADH dehydrogenase subunit 2 [Odorrana hainanensis]